MIKDTTCFSEKKGGKSLLWREEKTSSSVERHEKRVRIRFPSIAMSGWPRCTQLTPLRGYKIPRTVISAWFLHLLYATFRHFPELPPPPLISHMNFRSRYPLLPILLSNVEASSGSKIGWFLLLFSGSYNNTASSRFCPFFLYYHNQYFPSFSIQNFFSPIMERILHATEEAKNE